MKQFLTHFLALMAASIANADEPLTDDQVLQTLTTVLPRDRTIDRGLAFLRTQQSADGSLGSRSKTALTSLAIMAHLSAGRTPGDPSLAVWLRQSLHYVLAAQQPDGYFGKSDNSRMYGHGITTLMLAECFGMTGDEATEASIRSALERAVLVTVGAARVKKREGHEGGWRYQPRDNTSDLSLSGWQLMSLHATQQVGITVPREVIDAAVDYAKRLTSEDGKVAYDRPGQDHPALRGLGMLCFAVGGQGNAPEIDRIAEHILDDPVRWRGPWFFYRVYYDAVGMSRASPVHWKSYGPRLEAILIEHQNADGSWPSPPGDNERTHGPVYSTSMSVLALTVDRHLLPAYQR